MEPFGDKGTLMECREQPVLKDMCSKSHIGSSYLNAEVCISRWIALLRSGEDVNARGILQGFSQLDKI